jgi:class I fructose-bisphosphate aldolase
VTILGKAVRVASLRNPKSGRILTVAIDHVPSYGVLAGLENIQQVVDDVASAGPDAMLMMKGVAERCLGPHAGKVALILKCSSISPYHPERDVWVASVEDALRLGADAIAMAMTVGSADQPQLMANVGALVREAERVGLPVVVHAYPCGECVPPEERYSAERVAYASRMAMELGVDIIKTFYTGSAETFARVVEIAAPALVVAAGGPRLETNADVLQMAYDVVQAGAAGITFGRNIWQSGNTGGVIRALKRVVHEGDSVSKALKELG